MRRPTIKVAGLMLAISFFTQKSDNQPKPQRMTWESFIELFRNPQVRKVKDGKLFSPATFRGKRAKGNVEYVSMLVLDYDHDTHFEHDLRVWHELGCKFLVHTTYNHSEKAHRFRVMIPLAAPIPAADFPRLWEWAALKSGGKVDHAPSDASRMYYMPAVAHKDAPYRFEEHSGSLLDWGTLELPAVAAKEKRAAPKQSVMTDKLIIREDAEPLQKKLDTLQELNPYFKASWNLQRSDFKRKDGSDDASSYDLSLATYAVQTGWPDQEILDLMVAFRRKHKLTEKWKKSGDALAYYRKTIALARAKSNGHQPQLSSVADIKGYSVPAVADTASNGGEVAAKQPVIENSADNGSSKRKNSQKKEKFPKLNKRALHGLAGVVVRTILPHTEAHPAALLIQFLVAFGNVIGREAHFVAEADSHYMNLFAVLVGDTSKGRKGSSLGHILRLFRAADETWELERVQGGLSSAEGMIWAVRDPIMGKIPIKEKGRVVGYEEITVDSGVEDKRLMLTESEFSSVMRRAAIEGNTLSQLIRQAWDKGDLRSMTKNSPARASGAHISIIGHITKEELRRNLDEVETANGFANRYLWVATTRSKILPEGGSLEDSDLNSLISLLHKAITFARAVGKMHRDEEARALWFEVYERLSTGYPGMFGAVTSRAEAQVMRLACLYALLDVSPIVRRVHLEAALSLWSYCEDSARYIFEDSTGDRVANLVLAALRDAGEVGMTRTDISNLLGRNANANRIALSLSTLSECGLIRSEKEPSDGGRAPERWFAVDTTVEYELNEKDEISSDESFVPVSESELISLSLYFSSTLVESGESADLPF